LRTNFRSIRSDVNLFYLLFYFQAAARCDQPRKLARWQEELLEAIASVQNPLRPGRQEPRAKKRRPKSYQLLTQPRHKFKEIPHRERYRAAA
jgi:hypothetical protein